MAKRLFAILSVLYGEAVHLFTEGIHNVTHALWEHVAIACALEKLTYYTGLKEANIVTTAADYFVPIGVMLGISYMAWRFMRSKAETKG